MENVHLKLAGAHEEVFYTTLQRHHLLDLCGKDAMCDAIDVIMLLCVEKDDLKTNKDSRRIHFTRYCRV